MSLFSTNCPVVKRAIEKVHKFIDMGGKREPVEFEREILWVQMSEANVEFWHGGKLLRAGGCYNDHYGYLTSLDVQGDLKATMAEYGITAESSLELVLRAEVFLRPGYEDPKVETRPGSGNWLTLQVVPFDWRQKTQVDGEASYPSIERQRIANQVVWSSKNTDQENQALVREFKANWRVEPSPDHPGDGWSPGLATSGQLAMQQ